jgi:predicted nucleic acid-binding protein
MITAVDTSVLLDILIDDSDFSSLSGVALRKARINGRVIVCAAVVAEVLPALRDKEELAAFLDDMGIEFEPCSFECAALAGRTYAKYLQNRGPSKRVLPDFLVAAHAKTFADGLLARDRGYYREYFKDVNLIDPSK